jgi:peptide/nickel transport system substrate-binding protein
MASGWSSNANQTVWTLSLRPNLKWSDGSSLNSSDLAFTLKLLNSSGYYSSPYVNNITILNATSVQVNTQPGNFILYDIVFNGFELLPKETFGQFNASSVTSFQDLTNIVADGAFVITNYTSGENPIVMKANPYYWQGAPHFSELDYYQYSSQSAELSALESGQIDMIGCSASQCITVPGYNNINPPQAIPGHTLGIMFNDWTAPFNNSVVRRALAYATNITQINYAVNGPSAPNASENQDLLLPAYNQQIGFSNGTGPVGYSYNVTIAKQLFMQAGFKYSGSTLEYPNGTAVSFTLNYENIRPWQASAATLVTSQWAQVGILVQSIADEVTTFNNFAVQKNPVGWQVLIGEVTPSLLNNWGVTPGPGVTFEIGTYEAPVNGTLTFWNSTYAQTYAKLQSDVPNSSQFNTDAKSLAWMNAHEVPVVPLFNIFGNLITSNKINWGSPSSYTGIFNTQAETSPVFWDETLYEATPLSAATTNSTPSQVTVTAVTTVNQVSTVSQTMLTTVTSGGSTMVSTVTTPVATTIVSTSTTGTSSSSTLTYVGIGVIVIIVIIAAAVLAMRRR